MAEAQAPAEAREPHLSRQRLEGKVCLVTGGSSGIGKAICVQLAREGAHVIVLDVRQEPREGGSSVVQAVAEARQAEGVLPKVDAFVQGSVASAECVAAAIGKAVALFGRLDVLVNNAAAMHGNTLLETSEQEWDEIMSVNAKGTFLCTKAAVAQFLKQDKRGQDGIRGRVVNISSQHGMLHCPGNVAYGTSKAAVAYMTRQVGSEYIGEGIVVNAVAPGRILTGREGSRVEASTPEEEMDLAASVRRTPHGRMRLGVPQDVAKAVAFLASDQATFIVGENLMVDGGYMAS